jgi:hypothetical protein
MPIFFLKTFYSYLYDYLYRYFYKLHHHSVTESWGVLWGIDTLSVKMYLYPPGNYFCPYQPKLPRSYKIRSSFETS